MTTPLGPSQRSAPGFIIGKIGRCAPCDEELHHRRRASEVEQPEAPVIWLRLGLARTAQTFNDGLA